jgi:RNA polymerase sigma factor (sigma-70 family)
MAQETEWADAEIVDAIRQRPDDPKIAYLALWSKYTKRTREAFRKQCDDELLLDEVFDKSFLAFRSNVLNGSFEGKCSVSTYFRGIYKNKLKQALSRMKHPLELEDGQFDNEYSVFDEIQSKEESEVVKDLVEKMGGDCTKLILESYWDGLKQREMAISRGWTGESSVKTALSRCREKLRLLLIKDPKAMELIKERAGKSQKVNPAKNTIKR